MKTIGMSEIAAAIKDDLEIDQKKATDIVRMIINEMGNSIVSDKILKLSNFGTFEVKSKNKRIGYNFQRNCLQVVKERNVVRFRPSNEIREQVKGA